MIRLLVAHDLPEAHSADRPHMLTKDCWCSPRVQEAHNMKSNPDHLHVRIRHYDQRS